MLHVLHFWIPVQSSKYYHMRFLNLKTKTFVSVKLLFLKMCFSCLFLYNKYSKTFVGAFSTVYNIGWCSSCDRNQVIWDRNIQNNVFFTSVTLILAVSWPMSILLFIFMVSLYMYMSWSVYLSLLHTDNCR